MRITSVSFSLYTLTSVHGRHCYHAIKLLTIQVLCARSAQDASLFSYLNDEELIAYNNKSTISPMSTAAAWSYSIDMQYTCADFLYNNNHIAVKGEPKTSRLAALFSIGRKW